MLGRVYSHQRDAAAWSALRLYVSVDQDDNGVSARVKWFAG